MFPSSQANSVHVSKMCAAFAGEGVQVTLLHRSPKGFAGSHAGKIADEYGLTTDFDSLGFTSYRVPVLSRLAYGIWGLHKTLSLAGLDVVYGRDFYTAYLVALCANLPVLVEVHHPPGNAFERWLQRRLFAHRRCLGVVVISDALRHEYEQVFGDVLGERIWLARDAADPVVAAKPAKPVFDESYTVGYVGSLGPGKGIETIRDVAFAMPDIDFQVYGGSPEQIANLEATKLPPNLSLNGHVDHSKVPDVLASSDVLLAPYDPEVFVGQKQIDVGAYMSPLKVFEYMASGVPIVAANLPVIREILTHEQTALLAETGQTSSWVESITRLKNDPKLALEIATAALSRMRVQHTWSARARRILGLYGDSRLGD